MVSDWTGAEDGPFRLPLAGKCPVVHVKPKTKNKAGEASPALTRRSAVRSPASVVAARCERWRYAPGSAVLANEWALLACTSGV